MPHLTFGVACYTMIRKSIMAAILLFTITRKKWTRTIPVPLDKIPLGKIKRRSTTPEIHNTGTHDPEHFTWTGKSFCIAPRFFFLEFCGGRFLFPLLSSHSACRGSGFTRRKGNSEVTTSVGEISNLVMRKGLKTLDHFGN